MIRKREQGNWVPNSGGGELKKAFERVRITQILKMLDKTGTVDSELIRLLPETNKEIPIFFDSIRGHSKHHPNGNNNSHEAITGGLPLGQFKVLDYEADIFGAAIPDSSKATLIFNSGAIRELAAAGPYWLDLLLLTAKLPTVKMVVIPSLSADWYLRSGAVSESEKGYPEFTLINQVRQQNYKSKLAYGKLEDLLESASQFRADKKGHFGFVPGSNPKFLIIETEAQRQLSKQILALDKMAWNQDKKAQVFALNEIEHERQAIEEIARNAPIPTPVFIVTNDIWHLKTRGKSAATVHGLPIGTAKVTDYLRAEMAARKADLHNLLGISSIVQFCEAVVKKGLINAKTYPMDFNQTGPGKTSSGVGQSLFDILSHGVKEVAKHPAKILTREVPIAAPKPITNGATVNPPAAAPPANNTDSTSHATPPKQLEDNMTQQVAVKTEAVLADYFQTVGGKLALHREDRDMTQTKLAEEVRKELANPTPGAVQLEEITKDMVRSWETNAVKVPEDILRVLETILIDENSKITDKESAKKELREAWQRTNDAIDKGKPIADGIGSKIFELREQVGEEGITATTLANMINKRPRYAITEHPDDVNRELLIRIEANDYRPSKGLLLATVAALNNAREIPQAQIQEILTAATQEPKRSFAAGVTGPQRRTALPKPASVPTANREELIKQMMAKKGEINALLVVKDEVLSSAALSRDSGKKLDQPTISLLTGANNNLVPSMSLERANRFRDGIAKILDDKGQSAKNIQAFKARFDELMVIAAQIKSLGEKKEAASKSAPRGKSSSSKPSHPESDIVKLREAKKTLTDFTFVEGKRMRASTLAKRSGISPKHLSFLMGVDNDAVPNFSEQKFEKMRKQLVDTLELKTVRQSKFNEAYGSLVQIVLAMRGHAPQDGEKTGGKDKPAPKPRKPRGSSDASLDQEVIGLKKAIDELCTIDGKILKIDKITGEGVTRGNLVVLFNLETDVLPKLDQRGLTAYEKAIKEALVQHGAKSEQAEAFEAKFDELIALSLSRKSR